MNAFSQLRRLDVVIVFALVSATSGLRAEEKAGEKLPTEKTAPVKITATKAEPAAKDANPAKPHILPKRIEEVVKMSEAGVATEVLTKFIESSGIAYEPTGADIIALKQRGVPDDVTVVMLSRSSAIRAEYEAARKAKAIAAPAIVRTLGTDGELDPESYEFFWYHHAYPRVLASSYQTLAPYTQTYFNHYPHRDYNNGPKWRTDGFARESFTPGESIRRAKQPARK